MCLAPVVIDKPNQRLIDKHQLSGLSLRAATDFRKQLASWRQIGYNPTKYVQRVVPCGHCIECLRARQDDIATRAAREAEKRGSMHFLTLTYADKYLPLAQTLRRWDRETGEFVDLSDVEPLVEGSSYRKDMSFKKYSKIFAERAVLVKQARARILGMRAGKAPRYWTFPLEIPSDLSQGYYFEVVVTPSLSSRDVRLWLKSSRISYEREFGVALPDFSYLLCGEYGPNTCRPHYHVAFFGLQREHVQFFADRWKYGFTNLKTVHAVNEDGSSGFVACSKYVSKYIAKGRFECDSVLCKHAAKLRLCTSKHFGTDLPQGLVGYFRAYDLFGEYDIDSGKLLDGRVLQPDQLQVLAMELSNRNKITVHGKSMRLPQCLIKKIWYVQESDGYVRASAVRNVLSDLTRVDRFAVHFDEYRKSRKDSLFVGSDSDLLREFIFFYEARQQLEDESRAENLCSWYRKSLF